MPMTPSPRGPYSACQRFRYIMGRRLLMHEYVQKFTSPTVPRNWAGETGPGLIHPSMPVNSSFPSSDRARCDIAASDPVASALGRRRPDPSSRRRSMNILPQYVKSGVIELVRTKYDMWLG